MVVLYTLTIATGAALLFIVEPLFARLILPLLGGSPAVWTTAMVFFQAALLAAYAYAHVSVRRLGSRRQARWHVLVLLLAFAVLPLHVPTGWTPPTQATPIFWVLALLTFAVGLPFFVVSSTSPLLQRWFGATTHRRAADPYFLYAASNAGSMVGLLSYPLWIEPHLTLPQQTRLWTWGYVGLVVLLLACAVGLWRATPIENAPAMPAPESPPPAPAQRLHWVLLAFVPSSLMLGVTTYLSSEIAVVPLLWVIPLALYLLTFVLAFSGFSIPAWLTRSFPLLAVVWVLIVDMLVTHPIGGLMALHLAVFFVAALLCHAQLARSRPPADRLTEFYLWISLGGMLGGVFNGVFAPLVFRTVAEYPIAFTLACYLALSRPTPRANIDPGGARFAWGDWFWPLLLGSATTGAVLTLRATSLGEPTRPTALIFGVAALLCYLFSRRPARFALGVGALLLAGAVTPGQEGRSLKTARSFFGVHRVLLDGSGEFHVLLNGVTVHGRQSLDPNRKDVPLSYYYPTGPAGDVFRLFGPATRHVGIVGLGAGSLASYGLAGQDWTYYEIDPAVARIARDERYFTFLRDSRASVRVELGDARQSLVRARDAAYDLLVIDAYSSDAIPVHLVTREAVALYLRKLAPHGLLLFHISNQHLDLEPVFANLAQDAGVAALTRDDTDLSATELARGKSASTWLIMSPDPQSLAPLAALPAWRPSKLNLAQRIWTDDYSSILTVVRWH